MNLNEISENDRVLIGQLREAIRDELSLVPAYDDDFSLLRWITGWDRKIGFFFFFIFSLMVNDWRINGIE